MAGKNEMPPSIKVAVLVLASLAVLAFATEKPRSANPQAQSLIDKVWANRGQDWDARRLDQEIADLEEARRLDPNNHAILSYLAQCYFERGMSEEEKSPGNSERSRKYFERGYEFAKKSLGVKETSLGHYLAAISKGAAVGRAGIVEQARSFIEIKGHMDWIGKNDPNFHYGAYVRFWLDCYQYGPDPIIAIAGIGREDACGRLDAAIKREPRYLENHHYKLAVCTDPDDDKAYLATLDAALGIDPNSLPAEQSSNTYYHGLFHKMWKAKTGKDHP